MEPWLETSAIVALIAAGVAAGRGASRWPRWWWLAGYFVPLIMVLAVGIGRRDVQLMFSPGFKWLNQGRTGFAVLAFALPALTATILPRVSRPRERVLLS